MVHSENKRVLLFSMPFAGIEIPSIQIQLLKSYLLERNIHAEARHLYLKFADLINYEIYNSLIYPPNDSYTAQMIFSKYLFSEHWEEKKGDFEKYFNEKICSNINECFNFDFIEYEKISDNFFNWFFKNSNWKKFDIIGFTLNYGQFLPSLSFAKKIKEIDNNKIIVLGGSRTVGDIGIRTLKSFNFIDFIVSGEGEKPLYYLASDSNNYEKIPGLIYRKNNEIVINKQENHIDLDKLPFIDFDQFFSELSRCSNHTQQYFKYIGRLPIEISRGCWWNNCSFCNMNIQYPKYHEKNIDRIVEEINFLSKRYKMLDFQIISNTFIVKNYRELLKKIILINKDFNFIVEARAGRLKSQDYTLLKNAGFRLIQTGVESLSDNYLKKMNKGTKVIENIAALKFCMENNIKNLFNLIINYPNEELLEYLQTQQTIKLIKEFIDPPNICNLKLVYGSPIFFNYENYNIKKLLNSEIDKIMFPEKILNNNINFLYDYETKYSQIENSWKDLIQNWIQARDNRRNIQLKTRSDPDKYIFYFVDGGHFIRIFDKRDHNNLKIYSLNEKEREVFLSCIDVISIDELRTMLNNISENNLLEILNDFEKEKIIFKEEENYLSLPLSYKKLIGESSIISENNKEKNSIILNSY